VSNSWTLLRQMRERMFYFDCELAILC